MGFYTCEGGVAGVGARGRRGRRGLAWCGRDRAGPMAMAAWSCLRQRSRCDGLNDRCHLWPGMQSPLAIWCSLPVHVHDIQGTTFTPPQAWSARATDFPVCLAALSLSLFPSLYPETTPTMALSSFSNRSTRAAAAAAGGSRRSLRGRGTFCFLDNASLPPPPPKKK